MSIGPYPKTLHHPSFRPAILSANVGDEQPLVSGVAFPPVVVYNADDEAFHVSRGWREGSEVGQLPIVQPPSFQERKNIRAPLRNGVGEPQEPQVPLSRDYPKYVGEKIAQNEEQEKAILAEMEAKQREAEAEQERAILAAEAKESESQALADKVDSLESDMRDLKGMFAEFMAAWQKK